MKKNLNTILAVMTVVVMTTIALTACGGSENAETTSVSAETTETAKNTESKSESHEEIPTEPETVPNPQVGEAAATNVFEFTVTDAYIVDNLGPNKRIPEGAIYVVVEYDLKNISKQPVSSWQLPSVHLVDGNDAVYDQDSDASWYFDKYTDSKMISDMNPGIKTRDARIFEVSIDTLNAGGMRVYLQADRDILVDLNLYYGSSNGVYYGDAEAGMTIEESYADDDAFPSGYPGPDTPYYSDEGDVDSAYVMISQSSTEYISDTDVYWMTPDQLRRVKNEIYARHGRRFKDSQLQAWFDEQSWYKGTISPENFDENVLSAIEKANIKVIQHRLDVNSQ